MNRPVWVSLLGVTVVVGVLFLVPAAQGAQCGTQAAGDSEPLSGTLLLDKSSDFSVDFEKGTGEKRLLLIFEVSGCKLATADGIVAKPNGGDLPKATFGKPSLEADGKFLEVEIPVVADEFNPGKYSGTVRVSGATIVPTIQGVTLQRSEEPCLPTLLVIGFGLLGLVAAALMANANKGAAEKIKPLRILIAVGAVTVAVVAVWKGTYADAEVWKPDALSIVVLVLAVVPAAFGAAASALAGKGALDQKG